VGVKIGVWVDGWVIFWICQFMFFVRVCFVWFLFLCLSVGVWAGRLVGLSVSLSIDGWVYVLGLMNKCIGGSVGRSVGRWEDGQVGV